MLLDRYERHVINELSSLPELHKLRQVFGLATARRVAIVYAMNPALGLVECDVFYDGLISGRGDAVLSKKEKPVNRIGRMVAFGRALVDTHNELFRSDIQFSGSFYEKLARGQLN